MSKGFSIIELLIALAMSGIVMTAVYAAFKSQQDSYLAQDHVVEMQQNIRAGLDLLVRELRMAGFDGGRNVSDVTCSLNGTGTSRAPGILGVASNRLDFSMDLNLDGACADSNENLSYYVYTDGAGVNKLGRKEGASPVQAVAEHIENLEVVYLDLNGLATAVLDDIRSVQISILARSRNLDRSYTDTKTYTTASGAVWGPFNDNVRRRFQITTVNLRNLGI
jgi:type IV pilus assembly protein PilW